MTEFSKIKVGEVLSETSYYVVTGVGFKSLELKDTHGNVINIGKEYVEKILSSADQFVSIEEKNQTELIQLIMSNPRTACSIYFQKQDVAKTKKAYQAEVEKQAEDIQKALLAKGMPGVVEILKNPIKDYFPGEMRLIKGYHLGTQDERGRILFIDLEDTKVTAPKGVDPRTVEFVIVNNVKYIKK